MTVQTVTVVADVPDDQTTAAQAAAATFVEQLPDNAEGAVIISATFGGASLIPTPLEALRAATANLVALAGKTPRASASDLDAAAAKVDAATKAVELAGLTGGSAPEQPAAPADDAPTVNSDTVAATQPAPTGEPTPEAPAIPDDAQPVAGQPPVPAA